METIGFYTTKGPYGWCSNFYRAKIILDGKEWMTTEHYYQAQKSLNSEEKEMVRLADSPKTASMLGRSHISLRKDWEEVKVGIMEKAVEAKFDQHPTLLKKLLDTDDSWLVEDTVGSPRPDAEWGNGANGEGKNLLGKILMNLRSKRRK